MNPKTTVNILWTGGWDSTFRVIQLSKLNVIIQPYYLLCGRNSEQYELGAISKISELIRKRSSTVAILQDVITANINESDAHRDISDSYNAMLSVRKFGIQYDWLARLAREVNGLELSIHQDDKAVSVINEFGKVIKVHHADIGDFFILDPATSTQDAQKVFGNFRLPLLEYTKVRMKEEAMAGGFMDVMDLTWFCYFPINNEPCGVCNPCIYTIDEGLDYRFNKAALKRYRVRKTRELLRSIAGKVGLLYVWRYFKSLRRSEPDPSQFS